MIHPHPNWLQRRYFTWAQPHYDRMAPGLRHEVQRIDLWLYSRRGVRVWTLLALALGASTVWLWRLGLPPWAGVLLAGGLWVALPMMALAAWLQPTAFAPVRMVRLALLGGACGVLGAVAGRSARQIERGLFDAAALTDTLALVLREGAWMGLLGAVPMALLLGGVAAVRRRARARELAQVRHAQHRAEARLHALQAQIQPHFLFNTLATVQHWVDSGDARASGLLRELTAFLRSATGLLAQPRVRLADEMACVGHYLAVQQTRLAARLRVHTDVAADCAEFALPPGLVLMLAENAIEHGLAPALDGGTLTVRAWRDGEALHITVTDTGVGLPAQAADGTGLANTRARLAAAWGARASLQVRARAGGGTVARLRVAHA